MQVSRCRCVAVWGKWGSGGAIGCCRGIYTPVFHGSNVLLLVNLYKFLKTDHKHTYEKIHMIVLQKSTEPKHT